jgi:ribosome-associated toxin RatA of RatAB toxin-antitoxin module
MAEHGTASIDIAASPEELFAIVTDLESYPDWVEGMKAVEVHDVNDEGFATRATMTVDVKIRTITYTLVYEYEYPEVMSWTSEPGGDVRSIEGSYRFDGDEDATTVTYELAIDPGFPVPGFMIRQAQKSIMGSALDGLKSQAEG